MIRRQEILLLVFMVLLQTADAHNVVFRGKVVDRQTKTPLAGANVSVQGTPRGASADGEGAFILSGIPTGTYVINASSVGYLKQSRTVVIGTDTSSVTFSPPGRPSARK